MAVRLVGFGFSALIIVGLVLAAFAAPMSAQLVRDAAQVSISSQSTEFAFAHLSMEQLSYYYSEEEVRMLTKSSNPGDHDPNISVDARNRIEKIWDNVQLRLSGPDGEKVVPYLYCAVVTFENGVQYVRILHSEDGVTGTMSWYGANGWVHAFDGKDVNGFLNGKPRGAKAYDTGIPLLDCINTIAGGLPGPKKYAP